MDATTFEQVAFVIVSLASLGVVSFTVYYAIHPPISYREKRENNAIEYVQRILRRTPPNAQAITSTPEAPEGTNEKNRILCFDGKYFDTVADLTRHLKDIHHLSDDDLLSRPLSSFTLQTSQPSRSWRSILRTIYQPAADIEAQQPYQSKYFRYPTRLLALFLMSAVLVVAIVIALFIFGQDIWDWIGDEVDNKRICLEFDLEGDCVRYECSGDVSDTYYVGTCQFYEDVQNPVYLSLILGGVLTALLSMANMYASLGGFKKLCLEMRCGKAELHPRPADFGPTKVAELTGIVVLGMLFGFLSMFILVGAVVFLLSYRGLYVLLYSNLGTLLGIFVPLLLGDWLSVESHIWKRVLSKDLQHPSDPYKFSLVDILMTMFAIYKSLITTLKRMVILAFRAASTLQRLDWCASPLSPQDDHSFASYLAFAVLTEPANNPIAVVFVHLLLSGTKGKAGMIAPPVEGLARKTDAERERYFRLQSRWRLALLLHSRPALVAFRDQRSRSTIVAQEFEREQKELSDATIQARLDRHTTAFTHFIQQTYHLYKCVQGLVYGIPENPEEQSKLIGGSVASNMHRQDDKYGCFYHDVFAN
ncbi:hypothetical protein CYMTET_14758 [Cymbomonas tetramitiformis]|uniref:Uncharacterized protein n=1 Tax=Cymbomonas tetramitiformis TaxID=36881 RepID=A0AAE0GFN8_9CHLO|nr:hypothetical protein CYMTET_14758 [Cymbomonas tetramitiformis]